MCYAILYLWGIGAVLAVAFLGSDTGASDPSSKLYLLPWCLATAAVIAAPSVYLFYKGQFNPFHPLVFPGFVIGGLMLAFELSQPFFLTYIQDEHYNLPLTFVYIMIGYAGLTAG